MADSQHETAEIAWSDTGVPTSVRFDDPYFSLQDGLAETRHVFLSGNQLPARFRDGFRVAELGFGTGLNLLATVQLWTATGGTGTMHFTSFEAFPMAPDAMKQTLQLFPEIADLSVQLVQHWSNGDTQFQINNLHVNVILGDALTNLTLWQEKADAWFLDGFSPNKNPELWSAALMEQVARHTNTDGTFATYSAAGHVRQKLADAGFSVQRTAGFGRKRHMTIGNLKENP